jgi:hypothetical protein
MFHADGRRYGHCYYYRRHHHHHQSFVTFMQDIYNYTPATNQVSGLRNVVILFFTICNVISPVI